MVPYEVVGLASGKRTTSLTLGIGTPGPDWFDSVLAESLVWREYSAAGYEDHPVDCRHCWTLGVPAVGAAG